jgi:glycosyltransferase involved in cell wall biosynthesis
MAGDSISVIVASYNQPRALALVLEGLAHQDSQGFEVVVADDGSRPETFERLEGFAKRDAFPLRVTTQPDEGFRKARAMNNAILEASGERLVFLDGDCVPLPDLVRVHRSIRNPRMYGVGAIVRVTPDESRTLSAETIARGDHAELLTRERRARMREVHYRNLLYAGLRRPRKPKIRGGNISVSRWALDGVNGFDEGFHGHAGEDSDLRNRLNNLGARGKSLWSRAFILHVHHSLDPERGGPRQLRAKRHVTLLEANRAEVRTPRGLDGH